MLLLLSNNAELCAAGFMRDEPCAAKAGSVMLDFLQRLVGSKAKDMKLQGDVVELVKFNPKELLATLGQTVTALANCVSTPFHRLISAVGCEFWIHVDRLLVRTAGGER